MLIKYLIYLFTVYYIVYKWLITSLYLGNLVDN